MVAVDVFMFIHQIRLIAVTQFLHILLCNVCKLLVGKYIFRVRVDRDMNDWFLGGKLNGHLHFKAAYTLADTEISIFVQ